MFYSVKQYILYLLRSTNQHGVHSPFVYNLITKCFYDKTQYNAYHKISNFKKSLLKDKNIINVTDFGAGPKLMKLGNRSVSKIAINAGTTNVRAKLLYRLVNYFNTNTILELGTSLGIATNAMSLGKLNPIITTIEGCPNISSFTKTNFKKNPLNKINLITGDFNNITIDLMCNTYDLIFFDGNHQKKETLKYFKTLLTTTHNESVFIFDDIYWSKDMTEAWQTIKQHPRVSVTIDTFFWGIVFFRDEQTKEHFTIRL